MGFFLETAHPVKFDSVGQILGTSGALPAAVKDLFEKKKHSTEIGSNYKDLKEILSGKI
jgi:threonine synthase